MEAKEEKTNEIIYIKGDATQPVGDGQKIIVHVCNNIGGWGAGFVLALSKRWSEPEDVYRKMNHKLGEIDLVRVEDDILVCNLIGQEGTTSRPAGNALLPPVRYVAIEVGLNNLADIILSVNSGKDMSVHMPMIGSGLAGGNWFIIERIIEETLCRKGIPVTVYQFD